uniref:Chitin-binding type-2 domain-containing protein n=1 Tax=Anoplophora glabripennis TaxID=217634 RepID=V5GHK2_ANOGL
MTYLWKTTSVAVLLLAAVCVLANPSLLSTEECLDEVSWPDPTNCSGYYVCAPWGSQVMECASGTHYNPIIQTCDWPDVVGCVVSTTSTEDPIPTTVPAQPPTDASSTEAPSTEAPSTEMPSTELPSTEAPEEPTDVPEEPTEIPEESTEEPTEAPELSTESTEETEIPEESEPTETPEQDTPEPEPTETPEPETTESPEPTTVPPTTTTESKTPSDICAEFRDLFFITSYPNDCTRFIACNYGEPFILNCPEGNFFSPILSSCISDSSHCA